MGEGEYFNIFHHLGQTETMRDVYRYYKKTLKVMAYKQGSLALTNLKENFHFKVVPLSGLFRICFALTQLNA